MKTKSFIKSCLTVLGFLAFISMKAVPQTLTVCNCSNLTYTCNYVVTVNIQACDKFGLNCVSMVPQTQTINSGSCYTFTFNPPTGKGLVYSSASFNISSTAGGWSTTFGSTSSDATGNCFNASGSGGQVTHWTANGTSTSYTICPDVIVCCMRMTLVSPGINSTEINATNNTYKSSINKAGEVIFSDAYTVFPNPSNSDTYLLINSSKDQNVKVDIYNSQNTPVYSLSKEFVKGEEKIHLEGLEGGIYYMILQTENGVVTRRFSIQK
jgi:hypothetical protein